MMKLESKLERENYSNFWDYSKEKILKLVNWSEGSFSDLVEIEDDNFSLVSF